VHLTFPIIQEELFLSTDLDNETLSQSLDGLVTAGLISCQENVWSRAPAGSLQAVALRRLANVITPALERDYLAASVLAQAPVGGIQAEDLARQCQYAANRLSTTHGMTATELFDKHLHEGFIEALVKQGYVTKDNGLICPQAALFQVEEEARLLLTEQKRHAIIAACLAVSRMHVGTDHAV